MLEELGHSFPHLFPRNYLLVLQRLEVKFLGEEKQQNQNKVSWGAQLEEKLYLYLFSWLLNMWYSSSSNQCVLYIESLIMIRCLWLSNLGIHVSLIINVLHVVILVWGRYNSFCRSLGARGARGARIGLKGCLDQPSFVKVWTILIFESCLYKLAEPFASTFQPQYVYHLLNPSHRIFSFTTGLHYSKVSCSLVTVCVLNELLSVLTCRYTKLSKLV